MPDQSWAIERFNSILDLDASGAFIAREAIDVDYGAQARAVFTRDIVVMRSVDAAHARQFPISILGANNAQGQPYPVESSSRAGIQRFQLGDPRVAVSGKQTYRLGYQVRRALTGSASADDLKWSVTGVWPVRVGAVAIVVRPPAGGVLDATCVQGAQSTSKESCRASFTDKAAAFTATRALDAGEELTVDVRFAKGTFPEPQPLIVAFTRETSSRSGGGILVPVAAAVVLALVLVVAAAWWRGRRA
jgi:hypothetical protein